MGKKNTKKNVKTKVPNQKLPSKSKVPKQKIPSDKIPKQKLPDEVHLPPRKQRKQKENAKPTKTQLREVREYNKAIPKTKITTKQPKSQNFKDSSRKGSKIPKQKIPKSIELIPQF